MEENPKLTSLRKQAASHLTSKSTEGLACTAPSYHMLVAPHDLIWGGPIFSVSGEGDDEYGDELDELDGITCVIPRISLARSLMPMQQLSTLVDIRNSTHLRT